MTAFEHEILVEMFRVQPALACELLRQTSSVVLDGKAELATTDLSQALPTEYRADVVTVVKNDAGLATAAVIVEIQRRRDATKAWSWPVYVASLLARIRAPVILLVVTPYAWIGRWARSSIELGHPGFTLTPIVMSYADVPRITDASIARAVPELAVLSAMAHQDLEVATAATQAIYGLPNDLSRLYFDIVMSALPAALRVGLEMQVIKNYEYKSEFARRYVQQGREEGRGEAARDAILAIAGTRLGALDKADVERIAALDALAAETMLVQLGRSTTAAEARALLDRSVPDTEDE